MSSRFQRMPRSSSEEFLLDQKEKPLLQRKYILCYQIQDCDKVGRYTGILSYSWYLVDTRMAVLFLMVHRDRRDCCKIYWYHLFIFLLEQ
jgi:hypothetical protein